MRKFEKTKTEEKWDEDEEKLGMIIQKPDNEQIPIQIMGLNQYWTDLLHVNVLEMLVEK